MIHEKEAWAQTRQEERIAGISGDQHAQRRHQRAARHQAAAQIRRQAVAAHRHKRPACAQSQMSHRCHQAGISPIQTVVACSSLIT